MPPSPIYTQQPWTESYSEIIDVRSPSEYVEDRIPGAINLPVLDDAERAEVGTIYKQINPFNARKIGAALVAKNISQHLQQHFADKDKDYRPLVYCWRGGQRSNSMAAVLSQIGWRVTVLEGGYKTYRAYVRQQLEQLPTKFTYKILCGFTGSGKTLILRRLQHRGIQVLDLEAIANHRGSLLGEEWQVQPTPQPSQKYFESLLLQQLQNFDRDRVVWVESESNKIGQIYLPLPLWQKMKQSQCIEIQIPIDSRIAFLLREYPYLETHSEFLKNKLVKFKSRYGKQKLNYWFQLIDAEKGEDLVKELLLFHYDPTYSCSIQRDYTNREKTVFLSDLCDINVEQILTTLALTSED